MVCDKYERILVCRYDYLEFADDNNIIFGKYCGHKTGQTIQVAGEYVLITFHSDGSGQERGFSLLFNTTSIGMYNVLNGLGHKGILSNWPFSR